MLPHYDDKLQQSSCKISQVLFVKQNIKLFLAVNYRLLIIHKYL